MPSGQEQCLNAFVAMLLLLLASSVATVHALGVKMDSCMPSEKACQPSIGFESSHAIEYQYAFNQSISVAEGSDRESTFRRVINSGLLTISALDSDGCDMLARLSLPDRPSGLSELPPLRFALSNGRIRSVCPLESVNRSAVNSTAHLNLYRALLSMLQSSAGRFFQSRSLVETDILGHCVTHYSATGLNSFRKSKNLQECQMAGRFSTAKRRFSSWFSDISQASASRLIGGSQDCSTSLHPIWGSQNEVDCTEKLRLTMPTLTASVDVTVSSSLKLIERRFSLPEKSLLSDKFYRTDLIYQDVEVEDLEGDSVNFLEEFEALKSLLMRLCSSPTESSNSAGLLLTLNRRVRDVRSSETLLQLHHWLMTTANCSGSKNVQWQYLASLARANVDPAIVAMFHLLAAVSENPSTMLSPQERERLLRIVTIEAASSNPPNKSLSSVALKSGVDFLRGCLAGQLNSTCRVADVGPAMLAVSAIARKSSDLTTALSGLLANFLTEDGSIRRATPSQLTDWALLAIGNLGPVVTTESVIQATAGIIEADSSPIARRLLAVETLGRLLPTALATSALERLLLKESFSDDSSHRLRAAVVRALLPQPSSENSSRPLSQAIESLWLSTSQSDSHLAAYAFAHARRRLSNAEGADEENLVDNIAVKQLRQLVKQPPKLFSETASAAVRSVLADKLRLLGDRLDVRYELDWEGSLTPGISLPSRAEFQLVLHCPLNGFAAPLLDIGLTRGSSNIRGDSATIVQRLGNVAVSIDWVSGGSIGDLKRLLLGKASEAASFESVWTPSTLRVPTSLGQAVLVTTEAAFRANISYDRRPAARNANFKTDISFSLEPSFSAFASRWVALEGAHSDGASRNRSLLLHHLEVSADGAFSGEIFWRRKLPGSNGNGQSLSLGLRSPLPRQVLLRTRIAVRTDELRDHKTGKKKVRDIDEDDAVRTSWQECLRTFSRTLTGHNLCANIKKLQRQLSEVSLVLERQDPKADIFEATFEMESSGSGSKTALIFGNRDSPQRHFGLYISRAEGSEGSVLFFNAQNPVFPVTLNSSLTTQSKGGEAAASLRAGSQEYAFHGNWRDNDGDWRLTGDLSRVDRPWQRIGLEVVSDDASGTSQFTIRFPNASRGIGSEFGSLTLGRTLRLGAKDFNATVFAQLNELSISGTASLRLGVAGSLSSTRSSTVLSFVELAEARRLGLGWMRHQFGGIIERIKIADNQTSFNLSLVHRLAFATDHNASNKTSMILPNTKLDRTDRLNFSFTESRDLSQLTMTGVGEMSQTCDLTSVTTRLRLTQAWLNLSESVDELTSALLLFNAGGVVVVSGSSITKSAVLNGSILLIKDVNQKLRLSPLRGIKIDARVSSDGALEKNVNYDNLLLRFQHSWPALGTLRQSLLLIGSRNSNQSAPKSLLNLQQSLISEADSKRLSHQISVDGSIAPKIFSLNSYLIRSPKRSGFIELASKLESNNDTLIRLKLQVELATVYAVNTSSWWHQAGCFLNVEIPALPKLLRRGGVEVSANIAIEETTIRAAQRLLSGGDTLDRGDISAVTAAFLQQLWLLIRTARARQNVLFILGDNALVNIETEIDAVNLRLLHQHELAKGSRVLLDFGIEKALRTCRLSLEVAGRGSLRTLLSNFPKGNFSILFEAKSQISGRQGFLGAAWKSKARAVSVNVRILNPSSRTLTKNFTVTGLVDLLAGRIMFLAEQPVLSANQRLEVDWPNLGGLQLLCETTSANRRWGPDFRLKINRPAGVGRLVFQLNTSLPTVERVSLNYNSADESEGYTAVLTYVRYGHEFRADARGRGRIQMGSGGNYQQLMNLTVEQNVDLYGFEDAAPFSDIAKQLRLTGRLCVTRRAEVDFAVSLTSPASVYGMEPVVGAELLSHWWPLRLRVAMVTPVAHWRRCSAELRCDLSRRRALLSAGLSGPSSEFLALYEHSSDKALTEWSSRVLYRNNLLILTIEPQHFLANLTVTLAENKRQGVQSFVETSWISLQQLEIFATSTSININRRAHDQSLRLLNARRSSNLLLVQSENFGSRRSEDWILDVAFGANSADAFVANFSLGVVTGGGIGGDDFDVTLSGATAGIHLFQGRLFRLTRSRNGSKFIIDSGLYVRSPSVLLNATCEAATHEISTSKRLSLLLDDGGGLVKADLRFRGDSLDPNPMAASSVIIRGTEYVVEQPSGPSSLRISADGVQPVDIRWMIEPISLLKFRFRLNTQLLQSSSSSVSTSGTLDVNANLPSSFQLRYGRNSNIGSFAMSYSRGSFIFLHSVNGSFDGRVPLAPKLDLRLPAVPSPINVTAAWNSKSFISNAVLHADLWSGWRFRHQHAFSTTPTSIAHIETSTQSLNFNWYHDTGRQDLRVFGNADNLGEISATQNDFRVASANVFMDELLLVFPNLFRFPWRQENAMARLVVTANLTAPNFGLTSPAFARIESKSNDDDRSLVHSVKANYGVRRADFSLTIDRSNNDRSNGSGGRKFLGVVTVSGLGVPETLHYEADANWHLGDGKAAGSIVCRTRTNQFLGLRASASTSGYADFSVETDTDQLLYSGSVIVPWISTGNSPLFNLYIKNRFRANINSSKDNNWQIEWLTSSRHLVASRTVANGVSQLLLTPNIRQTAGVTLTYVPINDTTELRLPWRTIRLVCRRSSVGLSEMLLWPDFYSRPLDSNRLSLFASNGDSMNYTMELKSPYLTSPGFVLSLAANASRFDLLLSLSRAARLELSSTWRASPRRGIQFSAILTTPMASSLLEMESDLPDSSERINALELRNGHLRLQYYEPAGSKFSREIQFELVPFQRLFYSVKNGPLLDLSFEKTFGRLTWSLLASQGGARTPENAGRLLATLDASSANVRIELSSGELNENRQIYWPVGVPALATLGFDGTSAHAGALCFDLPYSSTREPDARSVNLWQAELVPANMSFGFVGVRLADKGSVDLINAWRFPAAISFDRLLSHAVNSSLIQNLASPVGFSPAFAAAGRRAFAASADALAIDLFAWQLRPDSDLTRAVADLSTALNYIQQLSIRDEFYLRSMIKPVFNRLRVLCKAAISSVLQLVMQMRSDSTLLAASSSTTTQSILSKFAFTVKRFEASLEWLAVSWRLTTSGHIARLRRIWTRLSNEDDLNDKARPDVTRLDSHKLPAGPVAFANFSTAVALAKQSLSELGTLTGLRLQSILFGHLADYKRLYDWLDDMAFEARRWLEIHQSAIDNGDESKLTETTILNELIVAIRLWMKTRRRSEVFYRLAPVGHSSVLAWRPKCLNDCAVRGGRGVAMFRARLRAPLGLAPPRLTPKQWRHLLDDAGRTISRLVDAIDSFSIVNA